MVLVSSLCSTDPKPANRQICRSAVTASRWTEDDDRYHLGYDGDTSHQLGGIGMGHRCVQAARRSTESGAVGYRPTRGGQRRSSRCHFAPPVGDRSSTPRCGVRPSDGLDRNNTRISDPRGTHVDAQRRLGVLVRGHVHVRRPTTEGVGMRAQTYQMTPGCTGMTQGTPDRRRRYAAVRRSHTSTTRRPRTNSTRVTASQTERNEHR